MQNLIIIGAGSNSRMIYSVVQYYHLYNVIGFAVNEKYRTTREFLGLPLYSLENLKDEVGNIDFVCFISLLWNHLNGDRKIIYEYCSNMGYKMTNIICPNAVVRSTINGDNILVLDFAIIENGCIIESDVAIMKGASIGPFCHIRKHSFLGTRSIVGGGCSIGEQCFVGLNSTIFDDTKIGDKCIIGACTPIKRNVPNFTRCSIGENSIQIKQYQEFEMEGKLVFSKNIR